MRHRRDRGFSLVELLVVVIVLGVLAAVAIPLYLNHRKKALDASLKADLRSAAAAAEVIAVDQRTATTNVFTDAAMREAGFRRTPGANQILIAGAPATGYCIVGVNIHSNATSSLGAGFWWDSGKGGLLPGPPGNPVGGVSCTNEFVIPYGWRHMS